MLHLGPVVLLIHFCNVSFIHPLGDNWSTLFSQCADTTSCEWKAVNESPALSLPPHTHTGCGSAMHWSKLNSQEQQNYLNKKPLVEERRQTGLQVLADTVKQNMLFKRRLYKVHCEREYLTLKLLIRFLFHFEGFKKLSQTKCMRAATINQEFHLQLPGSSRLTFKLLIVCSISPRA